MLFFFCYGMGKRHFRFLSLVFFILGIFFLLNSKIDITGAIIGISDISSTFSSTLGIILIIISVGLFFWLENLEEKVKVEPSWRKYPMNKDSIIQDVEQEYLNSKEEYDRTPVQERIERTITGKTIAIPNKRRTYEEQFYEGHASQGGRVIEVSGHVSKKGETKGKLIHFGQPANARYLWVVDEDGNFIVANRQIFQHDMENMNKEKTDYVHRLHKLPHATLAKGKKIYGSGEVLIEGGLIKEVNTHSGHYLPVTITPGRNPGEYENSLIGKFNEQGKEVFKKFSRKYGWKEVKKGATYI